MLDLNLNAKQVLITGAGSWIGREMAVQFARQGADLVLVGRNQENINETANLIQSEGRKVSVLVSDIKDKSQIAKFISSLNTVDVLIHNAAIYPSNQLADISQEEWEEVIDTNLSSAFALTQCTIDKIKQSDQGRIIFISSIAGERLGTNHLLAYASSKAGLNGFMRSLAIELAPHNVTVNSILPGNFINQERFNLPKKEYEKMLEAIPMNRVGEPKEIASLALFLASSSSGFITGETITVDGGECVKA